MAYETATSTGPQDLIEAKLATFAAAQGWTVTAATTGLVFSKGTLAFGLHWDTSNIYIRGCTGVNAGAAWNAQPGAAPKSVTVNTGAGPFLFYHFFGGSDYLHVAIEMQSGRYRHLAIGEAEKAGAYTGGAYYSGVSWSTSTSYMNFPNSTYNEYMFDCSAVNDDSHFRADIDGKTNNWMLFENVTTSAGNTAHGSMRPNGMTHAMMVQGFIPHNLLTPLFPIIIVGDRPSGAYSILGTIKDIRAVNLNILNPGDTITIGSDNWIVFPVAQKTEVYDVSGSSIESSGNYGYAYKIIP